MLFLNDSAERQYKMKKIFIIFVLVFSLSGCAGVSPYILTKNQTTLDLTKNRGVALFTLKIDKPAEGGNLSLMSFGVREANQYKPYNTLSFISIPFMQENYSAQDNLYFCSVVINRGIYRLDAFNGMIMSFFGFPYTLQADKIFDVYPGAINYLGRLDYGVLNNKVALMQLKSIEDSSAQDIQRFKEIFPVLKDKEIGKDSFY